MICILRLFQSRPSGFNFDDDARRELLREAAVPERGSASRAVFPELPGCSSGQVETRNGARKLARRRQTFKREGLLE